MRAISRTEWLRAISTVGLLGCLLYGTATTVAQQPDYLSVDWVQPNPSPSNASGAVLASDSQGPGPTVAQPDSAGSSTPLCSDLLQCGCDPKWYFSGGAVFLGRSRPDPAPMFTTNTGPGTIISASDFGFGWNAGPDLTLARSLDNGYLLEARYFNDLSASSSLVVDNVTTFRMAGIGVTILGGGSISGTYSTALDSSEFNVHAPLTDACTVLAGFRAIELQDRADFQIATPAIITDWHELNRMYGGQLGLDMALFSPGNPLQFNGVVKAGVYDNSADNQFSSRIASGDTSSATSTAFVGEVDFSASYQFSRHWAVRGGYEVLWIDNVALAGDAAAVTKQSGGGSVTPIVADGRLWYNGATVALDFTW